MTRKYNLSHQLIAYVLLISLFVQSCNVTSNQPAPQEKEQGGINEEQVKEQEGEAKEDVKVDSNLESSQKNELENNREKAYQKLNEDREKEKGKKEEEINLEELEKYRKLKERAIQGNSKEAQFVLGNLAYHAWQKQNTEEAAHEAREWLKKSAKQGNEDAVPLLNILREEKGKDRKNKGKEKEKGGEKSVSNTAISSIPKEKTAKDSRRNIKNKGDEDQGENKNKGKDLSFKNAETQYQLGKNAYEIWKEQKNKESYDEARRWLGIAADENHQSAKSLLKELKIEHKRNILSTNNTVADTKTDIAELDDYSQIYKWYNQKALEDPFSAQSSIDLMIIQRKGIFSKKNKREAIDFFELEVFGGEHNPLAYMILGCLYNSHGGKPELAFKWHKKAAYNEIALSQSAVARSYEVGKGVKKDRAEACRWYQKAHEKGHPNAKGELDKLLKKYKIDASRGDKEAQNALGTMYRNGWGVELSPSWAIQYYTPAAKAGYRPAQNNLGEMYYKGLGIDKDDQEAMDWFRKAATPSVLITFSHKTIDTPEFGYDVAEFNLGKMYLKGNNVVSRDDVKAKKWFERAATASKVRKSDGYPAAKFMLGKMYLDSKGDSGQNTKKAIELLEKAAEQGYAKAQDYLGQIYQNVTYVDSKSDNLDYRPLNKSEAIAESNSYKALKWYTEAAEQGHIDAQYHLGVLWYRDKDNIHSDPSMRSCEQAMIWFRKLAKKGHAGAQYELALMYKHGDVVKELVKEKDLIKCERWLLRSAKKGYENAKFSLGMLYKEGGDGIPQDYQRTIYWLNEASGLPDACYKLAMIYENGEGGVPPNPNKAMLLYSQASGKGHYWAQKALISKFAMADTQKATQEIEPKKIASIERRYTGLGIVNRNLVELKNDAKPLIKAIKILENQYKTQISTGEDNRSWQAEVPVGEKFEKLPEEERQKINYTDSVVTQYLGNHLPSDRPSWIASRINNLSNVVHKTIQLAKNTKSAITGQEVNFLQEILVGVRSEEEEQIRRLYYALKEQEAPSNDKNIRLAALDISHKLETEKLNAEINDLERKITDLQISNEEKISLAKKQQEIAHQREVQMHIYADGKKRLEYPVVYALDVFHDWKRSVFKEFVEFYLGCLLCTSTAIQLGTVARKPDAYQDIITGVTSIGATVAAFSPVPGIPIVVKVVGGALGKAEKVYATKVVRDRAAKMCRLYEDKIPSGIAKLSSEVAEILLFRFKDLVKDLDIESLDKLAKIAVTQAANYAVKKFEKPISRNITIPELFLLGSKHKPSWLKEYAKPFILKTELKEGDNSKRYNGWKLLRKNEKISTKELESIEKVHNYAGKVLQYGPQIIKLGISGAEIGVEVGKGVIEFFHN